MVKAFRSAVVGLILLTATGAGGADDFAKLTRDLSGADDFRVRVQAALHLGKSGDARALGPLYGALSDESAAVRASAAAALKTLSDPAALPALREHARDSNTSVRKQVQAAISVLEARRQKDAERRREAKVLIKLGKVRNATQVRSEKATEAVTRAARSELDKLDGVALLNPSEDPRELAEEGALPVVLLTGKIRKMQADRDGSATIYSAEVEYIVHRMPEQAIVGKISGRASARADRSDRNARVRARSQVLESAVARAMQSAPRAILAVTD